MRLACGGCALVLSVLLVLILFFVVEEGAKSVRWSLFTHLPTPAGVPGGGMGNAILGSLIMVGMAAAGGVPIGILCGVYLAEFGKGLFGDTVRFLIEVLNGVPTIVSGMVAYAIVVETLHHFSAYAGATALAIILIPLVARASELAIRQVSLSWREASTALGASAARTILSIVIPGARAGIVTAAMLAIARVAGETAPLLFTALGNDVEWPKNLGRATAALPLQIFNYAMSPYAELQSQAWAGALVLVAGILAINLVVRVAARTGTDYSARM